MSVLFLFEDNKNAPQLKREIKSYVYDKTNVRFKLRISQNRK